MSTIAQRPTAAHVCPVCDGSGEVEREVKRPCPYGGADWDVPVVSRCVDCGGTGVWPAEVQ